MARKKITQNVNKDAGLMDLPKVKVPSSQWNTKWSNYLTCNIGEIVPVYVDEVLPKEKRKVDMGMLSHMTTPIAPIFNAQYTEFRTFFVPFRLCADLLGGFATRKSPWVKVFGEDPAVTSSNIIVSLSDQKLPSVSSNLASDFASNLAAFGGVADALGYDTQSVPMFQRYNFLDMAAYELIYQHAYRNENRESATYSSLYKWLYNLYNRTSASGVSYSDSFHIANREKDYFTGCQPFTQKGGSISAPLQGTADLKAGSTLTNLGGTLKFNKPSGASSGNIYALGVDGSNEAVRTALGDTIGSNGGNVTQTNLYVDLSSATGVDIEQLRIMIKTQELLEKDMMYGTKYIESLNAHFGTAPISLVLEEPLELKKVTITSQMQPIFQTSTTASEPTILGTIGANATTQTKPFEILPWTEFKEHGILMVCAVHKAQNSYDSLHYKPKRIFKSSRFDFYTPELNDLGFQPVQRKEFSHVNYSTNVDEAVGYNEAFAEYRFKFNQVHGMFEPSRNNALSYWTLAMSNYADIDSIYKQGLTELNRAISVTSSNAPQFFDAYGFIETNDKPMSLHSIPGMDGVI